ncbi:MAG: ribosome small subunit-dependent GTPase A [Limisphaerales bacterium]
MGTKTPASYLDSPLTQLGWNARLEAAFAPHRSAGLVPARVAVEHRHFFTVFTVDAELTAQVAGKLLHESVLAAMPKVGDWVALTLQEEQEVKATIHAVLPRATQICRKEAGRKAVEQVLAANIDVVFVVQGLDDNFNLRRLERFLVMVHEGGAKPVILLNKTDLCPHTAQRIAEVQAAVGGTPVLAVSALKGAGVKGLWQWIHEGVTVAFIGSSGVGKSTIINRLFGEDIQDTLPVRETDAKGRHTTTRRELIVLPRGGVVMDTPGMREFHLWLADTGLQDTFPEIEEIALRCHFTGCGHTVEKKCAVLGAVESGELTDDRYRNYLKLRADLQKLEEATRHHHQQRQRLTPVAQRALNQFKRGRLGEG